MSDYTKRVKTDNCGRTHRTRIFTELNEILPTTIQIFHRSKVVSFYELFVDIVKWSLDFSFLARPVAGTGIKFCSQVSCHKQGMGIITDGLQLLDLYYLTLQVI